MSPVTLRVVIHEESLPKVITGQSAKRLTGKNLILLNDTEFIGWSNGVGDSYAKMRHYNITIFIRNERLHNYMGQCVKFESYWLNMQYFLYNIIRCVFYFMQYSDLCEEDSLLLKPVLADLEAGSAFELTA